MQSLTWYVRRLRSMSAGEMAWRLRAKLRDELDRGRVKLSVLPRAPAERGNGEPGFRVSDVAPGEWSTAVEPERSWLRRLCAQADTIAAHRLTFLGLDARHLGDPIDWNRDHESGRPAPLVFAPTIDYRDHRVTGDAKLVWEPSRHHQLVVLARAYRAGGEARYAEAAIGQLTSWLDQCPFGRGMGWRSPLELAIRLINWVWTFDLVHESGLLTGALRARVLESVHLHIWDITRKYSQGSSANNHLVGEAAGVFIACSYFPHLDPSGRHRARSRALLAREIGRQTHADGGNREQAFGYHLFVLQFFLLAGVVARRTGQDFAPAYWSVVEQMLEFLCVLTEAGDLPLFGDADDGYVLDLGGRSDARAALSHGAVLFGRSDFKAGAGELAEDTRWLLGRDSRRRFEAISTTDRAVLASRSLADSGYYLLQCGRAGSPDAISVVFDCGELGFGSLAAHGHADALSFTLRVGGEDVFVDPGTFDYFTHPAWRRYFRSTGAHNTLEVDGMDQSEMLGPFLWGRRAEARCLSWAADGSGAEVLGEHDGYRRLPDPVAHRRGLRLDYAARILEIRDEVQAQGSHQVVLRFHLSEACEASLGDGGWRIAWPGGGAWLELDPALDVEVLRASESPPGGWVSRGYHRRTASTTLQARAAVPGGRSFTSRVRID